MILNENNQYSLAINDYSHAIKLDGNYWKAYFYRACCYEKTGNYEDAINDLNAGVKICDDDGFKNLFLSKLKDLSK